jgi:hypothetical protein
MEADVMSRSWGEALNGLRDFIKANPSITIDDVVLAIPGEIRPEFYRLFDEVRTAFVEEKFPGLLEEAGVLGENYRMVEQEVKDRLKLEGILNFGFLDRYLHEPTKELTRELFNPLFDLIRGHISADAFEKKGVADIEDVVARCQKLGYAKWVALTLVKQLEPDKIFAVNPPESKLDGHGEPLCCEMPVAYPEAVKYLTFHHGSDNYPPFITPHFIIHSAKLNKYVAFRSEMNNGEYISLNASGNREWYKIAAMIREYKDAFKNPSLLIYVSSELEDLALIADKDRMNRPDMIVDIRDPGELAEPETPTRAKLYDILNPQMGRYVISREPLPEKLSQLQGAETKSDLHGTSGNTEAVLMPAAAEEVLEEASGDKVFSVGFDQSKLQLIMEGFQGQQIDNLAGQGAA